MKFSHVAAGLATALLVVSFAGCAAPAPAPAETAVESATPTPTPTPTPDTVVTQMVMWGDHIVAGNAAGDPVDSIALGGTNAEPIISFLSAALGAEPVRNEVQESPETCRPGSYARWADSGGVNDGVSVYAGLEQDGSPAPVVVRFVAPEANGVALRAGFGAQVGDDVAAYLASDAVLVVDSMTPSAADIASGKTLLVNGNIFIFDVIPEFSTAYPFGVASYVGDGTPGSETILNGIIAPGSWSAGHC